MGKGPEAYDWFGDLAPEERRLPDVQSDEDDAAHVDHWLNETGERQPRQPWVQTIDRRTVTIGAAALVVLVAILAAAGVFRSGSANTPR